jgi:Fe-S oxidoreductase
MLSYPEKIIFILALLASGYGVYQAVDRIRRLLERGQGRPNWQLARRRLISVTLKVLTFQPVFRFRFLPSLFHGFVAWGFIYYLLVNVGDVLSGFIPHFVFLGNGWVGDIYRLGGDLLSVAVLVGMIALTIRRFILKPIAMTARPDVLLDPHARQGIRRDSAIVSAFILVHVGARFLGESIRLAKTGPDAWQPFASLVSVLWQGMNVAALSVGEHITFWLALGAILAFFPYFLYSKHIHLFIAPLNFLLKPERRSIGELDKLDFDNDEIEQFGALHLEDLGWEQLLDSYACIMCYRCQEVCPAYHTGKILSPAALEINKRYYFNKEGKKLANGEASSQTLLEFAIPAEAVWACTACGACVDICPVGNEPMRDILDIRRALVLMENDFPDKLQTAFRGMERTANPWNIPPAERLKWAEGLDVPTVAQNPNFDVLWWVGCAPATDARAQKTARAFARILQAAGVNFAVLGAQEQCTGDAARRAGNEYLFNELATANVETLNATAPKRIVTTCPHCLHTLKNEYPAFGGHFEVIHHTQMIDELLARGNIKVKPETSNENKETGITNSEKRVVFHDPCYLGRHNGIIKEPRQVLEKTGVHLSEMANHGQKSFCCGAGGAQMWKEEEAGTERVSASRFKQAQAAGKEVLAVGCPFCLTMLTDANKETGETMQVLDVAEVVLARMDITGGKKTEND